MASYRYERDIDPKDLKPRKQRQGKISGIFHSLALLRCHNNRRRRDDVVYW